MAWDYPSTPSCAHPQIGSGVRCLLIEKKVPTGLVHGLSSSNKQTKPGGFTPTPLLPLNIYHPYKVQDGWP